MESEPAREPANLAKERPSPFRDEADVLTDHVAQHDDISTTQSSSTGTAHVSAEHVSNLLYQPGYIWDPRSSPQGVDYYPAYPDSSEDETTTAQA